MNKTNNFVCGDCGVVEGNNTRVEEREETYTVKGESITVRAQVRICERCDEGISDEQLDHLTLQSAYDVYRVNHRLIFPAEIKALRELYGLSQRGLSSLLGWGAITIHRYEAGNLPDESHNRVLRLIRDPFNMAQVVEENGHVLDNATQQRLTDRISELLSERVPEKVTEVIEQSARRRKASIFTGFLEFHPETLMEMMVFFAHRGGGVLKTKLNKLLWYADFLHYKHHAVSISGATYIHLPYGPVPDNYGLFLVSLYSKDTLTLNEVDFGVDSNGESIVGEQLLASRAARLGDLTPTACAVLEEVHRYFEPIGSKKISDLSHQEEGYTATGHRQPISYEYADRLKVDPIQSKGKRRR